MSRCEVMVVLFWVGEEAGGEEEMSRVGYRTDSSIGFSASKSNSAVATSFWHVFIFFPWPSIVKVGSDRKSEDVFEFYKTCWQWRLCFRMGPSLSFASIESVLFRGTVSPILFRIRETHTHLHWTIRTLADETADFNFSISELQPGFNQSAYYFLIIMSLPMVTYFFTSNR